MMKYMKCKTVYHYPPLGYRFNGRGAKCKEKGKEKDCVDFMRSII